MERDAFSAPAVQTVKHVRIDVTAETATLLLIAVKLGRAVCKSFDPTKLAVFEAAHKELMSDLPLTIITAANAEVAKSPALVAMGA